jgi:hypothetical protein
VVIAIRSTIEYIAHLLQRTELNQLTGPAFSPVGWFLKWLGHQGLVMIWPEMTTPPALIEPL